jgi:transposase
MFFLKDADLMVVETIAIDGTKANTIARKPILIKRKSTNM